MHIPIGHAANLVVTWMESHLGVVFHFITFVLASVEAVPLWVFSQLPRLPLLAGFAVLAILAQGWWSGLYVVLGGLLILDMQLWPVTMSTLALVVTAAFFALVIGIPVGIWAGQSRRAQAVLRPVLDFMQTMPPFVYLIPAVLFFGLGAVPALFATFVFSVPPAVRLTELGLRQVPEELVEAGEAFGATAWQSLIKIKLPLALPSILTGVNQTIMLALSMVVIAGMIGTGGLGATVLQGIASLNVGEGFRGGLGVVLVAIYLDRMTERLGRGNLWIHEVRERRKSTLTVGEA